MSYILEALKKSDQERQRKTVPGIQSVYAEPGGRLAPRKRRLWPYLLILALILNVGLLFRQLYPPSSPKPAQDAPKQVMQPSPAVEAPERQVVAQTSAPAPPAGNSSVLTSPPAGQVPPDNKAAESGADRVSTRPELKRPADPAASEAKRAALTELPSLDVGKSTPIPPETRPAQSAPAKAIMPPSAELRRGPPGDARPAPMAEGTAQVQSDLEEVFGKLAPLTGQTAPQLEQHPAEVVSPKPASPAAAEQKKELLPELHELPPNLRSQIPEFSFSMFVYSKEPASRLVSVKGQVVREGQDLAPGLKLETITPEGAILSFRGQRFIKKMF